MYFVMANEEYTNNNYEFNVQVTVHRGKFL